MRVPWVISRTLLVAFRSSEDAFGSSQDSFRSHQWSSKSLPPIVAKGGVLLEAGVLSGLPWVVLESL